MPALDFTTGLVASVLLLLLLCNLATFVRRCVLRRDASYANVGASNDGADGRRLNGERLDAENFERRQGEESLPASKDQFLRADGRNMKTAQGGIADTFVIGSDEDV